MRPSREHLEADKLSAPEINQWLKVRHDLVILERFSQLLSKISRHTTP
jgi:hypothetical protein